MSKKLILISANQLRTPYPIYPIGISYLSTYLKTALPEFEIKMFDMNFGSPADLGKMIDTEQPDYIGISIRNIDGADSFNQTDFISDYKKIIQIVRSRSNKPLILGGAGFSVYAKKLFELFEPDFAVHGEGEQALAELLACLEYKKDYTRIEGLLYKKNDRIILNSRKDHTDKLRVDYDDKLIDYYWEHSGMLNIQTKRGCYYKCIYCSYPLIEGRKIRTLNAEEIVDNLERLSKEKGIDYVFFTDSIFNIATEKNIELAEMIIRRNIKIRWAAYFSPSNLSDEELALYKRSGLSHMEFGTESFSDTQLKNYGKNFTFETALETSELALKHNIFYAHFLILGGYGETNETLAETFENSKRLRYTVMFPFVGMRIYPGTKLQEYAVRDGIITADDDLITPKYYISSNFDQQTLKEKAKTTGKAWVFSDDISEKDMQEFRIKRKKKGLIWEYLRKP